MPADRRGVLIIFPIFIMLNRYANTSRSSIMKRIAWLFLLLAMAAAFAAYGFTEEAGNSTTTTTITENREFSDNTPDQKTVSTTYNKSRDYLAMPFGIIASACFVCSALLFIKAPAGISEGEH